MKKKMTTVQAGRGLSRPAHYKARSSSLAFEDWETLDHHLMAVAMLISPRLKRIGFTEPEAEEWALCMAVLHDLGKRSPEWQRYLQGGEFEDHKTAGAIYASDFGVIGRMLSYALFGHHGSIPDHDDLDRATSEREILDRVDMNGLIGFTIPKKMPSFFAQSSMMSMSWFIRMLNSVLVDADRLAAEMSGSPYEAEIRSEWQLENIKMFEIMLSLEDFQNEERKNICSKDVREVRESVYKACMDSCSKENAIYTLQAPTGSGKTLSGFLMAARSAMLAGKERIIYVTPFINITEQVASILRGSIGEDSFVEHHSNVDWYGRNGEKRCSENWEAPVVLTTFVQFFETLYTHRPDRNRKLHNISNSVVIIDECHLIPIEKMRACTEALNEAHKGYGTTFILMSATMPSYSQTVGGGNSAVFSGMKVREVIKDPQAMSDVISGRVSLSTPNGVSESYIEDVIEHAKKLENVLVVTNLREHAYMVYQELRGDGVYFLSGSMCSAHRRVVLDAAKARMSIGLPTKVVSTSVISTGEDISFDNVISAMSTIPSLLQTAGRANRHGVGTGNMYVYYVKGWAPDMNYGIAVTRSMLSSGCDIYDLKVIERYYRSCYRARDIESMDYLKLVADNSRLNFCFSSVGKKFKMIQDTIPVVVDYGDSMKIWHSNRGANRQRMVQRYIVNVYPKKAKELIDAGIVKDDNGTLIQDCVGGYDDFGLWMGFANQKLP